MQTLYAEEYSRELFNVFDQGFCTIEVLFDDNGKPNDYLFLEVNAAFVQHTGLEDVVGRRIRDLAPAHEVHWFEIYGQVALSGLSVRFEQEAAALKRWYDVYAFRVGAPHLHRVAVMFSDITERKQAQLGMATGARRGRNSQSREGRVPRDARARAAKPARADADGASAVAAARASVARTGGNRASGQASRRHGR